MNGIATSAATRISNSARSGQIICMVLGFLLVAVGALGAMTGGNQSVSSGSAQIELLWMCGESERSVQPGVIECQTISGPLPGSDELGANRIRPPDDDSAGHLIFVLVGLAFLIASLSIAAGARREPVPPRGVPLPAQAGPAGQPAYPAQWPAQPPPA